ncbi:AAA family ATPase [Candidatus Latescibacterota bacterium]
MNILSIELKNCYGINNISHEFDFSHNRVNLIYAPNGSMKTSLANTFIRISEGKEPEEKINNKKPFYHIKIDNNEIKKEEIFVIEPFNDSFKSESISTLLVNKKIKSEYDLIYNSILDLKYKLITQLNKLSKVKKDEIESQILKDFHVSDFYNLLNELVENIENADDYENIMYATITDPKVIELLDSEDIQKNINAYVNKYDELLEKSTYYKRGIFNPARADNVLKTLKKENYFDADHSLLLNGENESISDVETLKEKLENERVQIFNDKELKAICDKIISGVVAIRNFQDLLEQRPEITLDLINLKELRKKLWLYYFKCNKELITEIVQNYSAGKVRLSDIEKEAKIEETQWFDVKRIFEDRFHVPFEIDIRDKKNVILGTKNPNIIFRFKDDIKGKELSKDELQKSKILSLGELRALYLIYIIFEVRARIINQQKTLFIIDDIADSFDYKNKYAIIEYLKEMSTDSNFILLILTHNFDFYRTIQSRILDTARWENSFVAQRGEDNILLLKGGNKVICNPFGLWKNKLNENKRMLIASIPFIRNLIEYKDGNCCVDYSNLTSLLHIKNDTYSINIQKLENIFQKYLSNVDLTTYNKDKKVIELIYESAEEIVINPNNTEIYLENKICLSIVIRLIAEKYMWNVVSDKTPINGSQTGKLFDKLKNEKKDDDSFKEKLRILGCVNLMTPENIHLNSFMYEPLIDMSDHHLSKLYEEVKSLEV